MTDLPPRPNLFTWLKNNSYRKPASPASQAGPDPDNLQSGLLNTFFSSGRAAASIRLVFFMALILIMWGFVVMIQETCPRCEVLLATAQNPGLPLADRLYFFSRAFVEALFLFFSPRVFSHILALLIPLWLAIQIASLYLDDIFELHNTRQAALYLFRAAFAFPNFKTIQIKDGHLSPADRNTMAVKIGGPAYAQVHLENAAVFEPPFTPPLVIGPTNNFPGRVFFMPGFTRIRQVVDLRDQVIPISEVTARTRDGIRIKLKNIRLLYSIRRSPTPPQQTGAYPFSLAAVLTLVYTQAGSGSESSVLPRAIIGLVSSELVNFISQYTLADLLSTIGLPEIRQQMELDHLQESYRRRWARRARRKNTRKGLQNLPQKPFAKKRPPDIFKRHSFLTTSAALPAIRYVPRTTLSSLFFADFKKDFASRTWRRGLRLEWIDVGTWQPPVDFLSDQHQEAFRITNENIARGHPEVLNEIRNQSRRRELAHLIRTYPLSKFHAENSLHKSYSEIIFQMLWEYHFILKKVAEDIKKTKGNPPERLLKTLDIIQYYVDHPQESDSHYTQEG